MPTTAPATRNGVDTATLFATLDAVKEAPAAARFQFRSEGRWIDGTHSQSTIHGFFGVGEERAHERAFTFDADHPAVLVGKARARPRSSSCSTRCRPASPQGWPTSPRPGRSPSTRSPPRWPATST